MLKASVAQAMQDLCTVKDVVRYGTTLFNAAQLSYGHGCTNAWDEASALVLHALAIEYDFPHAIDDCRLSAEEKTCIAELFVRRISERMPVPYLTNTAYFANLPFYVDERVLIPRSPIAELIEEHFEPWIEHERVTRVLDLCTGSGCLAIATALTLGVPVDAVDISQDALAVAKINVDKFNCHDLVTLVEGDVYDNLGDVRYDVIVTNPPYVGDEEMATLPAEYDKEPTLALRADDNGLAIVRKILDGAPRYLSDEGILIMEVGNSAAAVAETFTNIPFVWLEMARGGDGICVVKREDLV